MEPPLILSGLGGRACLRLIVIHLGRHRDGKADPGVDGGQGKHQRNHLLFVDVRSCEMEDSVGQMTFRDPCDGASERERRAFALGVEGRLLPRVEHVKSLLGLGESAGVFRMHVEAIRAPIAPLLLVGRRSVPNPSVKLTLLSIAESTTIRQLWPRCTPIDPIVDPLGGSPFFLVLTREYSPEARKALSWRIAMNSFFLLVGSYFVGT
jgi:hypothetical protein